MPAGGVWVMGSSSINFSDKEFKSLIPLYSVFPNIDFISATSAFAYDFTALRD